MIQSVKRLLKLLQAVVKILPVVLEVLNDLADDGKRNNSNAKPASKAGKQAEA